MRTDLSTERWVSLSAPSLTRCSTIVCLAACVTIGAVATVLRRESPDHARAGLSERRLDENLQKAATEALQQREGTIIVVDPQTGRIRALVNSEIAVESTFAPGSTLKPFVAIAAMRAGLIDKNSRTLCRQEFTHDDFKTVCSHRTHLAPLNPADAIAYSCNYYFARLGERMDDQMLNPLLYRFGFGQVTQGNFDHEATGRLVKTSWKPQNALGEPQYVQATPLQLLMAYSALVNGGHLWIPTVGVADNFKPSSRADVPLSEAELEVILEGMRGAVLFGTAERADLTSLPFDIVGKTGTSDPSHGFRSQGWFVGFASEQQNAFVNPALGVLVFLRRGHGFDAAEVSRRIFEEYARLRTAASAKAETAALSKSEPAREVNTTVVRVHFERENVRRSLSLENYVQSVVAAEGSLETKIEALKALAVASRTYAVKNLGRHASEGFDFCNMTHCQRALIGDQASDLVRRAVSETEGEILRDSVGQLAESYFSASCGGETANIAKLWNTRPEPYLEGVRDEFCVNELHSHWTDVISSEEMLRAVRTDARTDVGNELRDIIIRRRDETGRAELVSVVGRQQRLVNGWDFKIIVGRALGWNHLKSSRFVVSRVGSNFVFRGSGFGHGLGLCQEGAHVMAERGFGYRQILLKYFPGVSISTVDGNKPMAANLVWSQLPAFNSSKMVTTAGLDRRQLSSTNFRVTYPIQSDSRDAEQLLQLLEASRTALLQRPSLPPGVQLPFIEVFVNQSTGDFVARTGLPWWAAAGSAGNRIELQPLQLLQRRRILETTLRHELVHKLVDSAGNGRSPRWLAEGLALYVAGEGQLISRYIPAKRIRTSDLERKLAEPADGKEMRELYALAYVEVRELIKTRGEGATWKLVQQSR